MYHCKYLQPCTWDFAFEHLYIMVWCWLKKLKDCPGNSFFTYLKNKEKHLISWFPVTVSGTSCPLGLSPPHQEELSCKSYQACPKLPSHSATVPFAFFHCWSLRGTLASSKANKDSLVMALEALLLAMLKTPKLQQLKAASSTLACWSVKLLGLFKCLGGFATMAHSMLWNIPAVLGLAIRAFHSIEPPHPTALAWIPPLWGWTSW